jgi:hypothetical protein
MKTLGLVAMMLVGCGGSNGFDHHHTDFDVAADLSRQDDMKQPDDLATTPDMTCLADTQTDTNNCGSCGVVCSGTNTVCVAGLCEFKHTDTLCGLLFQLVVKNEWIDANATVDGSNSTQALTACQACLGIANDIGYTTSFDCVPNTGSDSSGNNYTGYGFMVLMSGVYVVADYWYLESPSTNNEGTAWGFSSFGTDSTTPNYSASWTE